MASAQLEVEPYRRRIRASMRGRDLQSGDLTHELEEIEKTAIKFLDGGDAETAYRILLTLLEEGPNGFECVDNSSGELGDCLSGFCQTLAEIILSLDPDETRSEEICQALGETQTC